MYLITFSLALTNLISTDFSFYWDGNSLSHKIVDLKSLNMIISHGCVNNNKDMESSFLKTKKIQLEEIDFNKYKKDKPLITSIQDLEREVLSYINSENDVPQIDYTCTYGNIDKDKKLLDNSQSIEFESRRMINIADLQHSYSDFADSDFSSSIGESYELQKKINEKRVANDEIPIQFQRNPLPLNEQAMELNADMWVNPLKYFDGHITKEDLSDTNPSNPFDLDFRMTDPHIHQRRLKFKPHKFIKKLKKMAKQKKYLTFGVLVVFITLFILYFWLKAIYIYYFQSIVDFSDYPKIETTYSDNRDTSKVIITLSSEDEIDQSNNKVINLNKPQLFVSSYDVTGRVQNTIQNVDVL